MAESPRNIGVLTTDWWAERATEVGEFKNDAAPMFTDEEVIRYARGLRTLFINDFIPQARFEKQMTVYQKIAYERKISLKRLDSQPNSPTTGNGSPNKIS